MATEEQINKEIETNDELSEITAEQLLTEMENDVAAYEKAVERSEKDLANYNEQLVVDRQLWDILEREGSMKKLTPTYEYETDPQWYSLMQQKQRFQIRQDKTLAESTVKQLEATLQNAKEAHEKAKKKLSDFKLKNIELVARQKRDGEN